MELPFDEPETLVSCVLVVDDEPTVRDVFTRLLSREPELSVQTADSAESAMFLLRSQRFDLLITDKNLPAMNGIELIVEARKLRPHIEAIMITGYASAESVIAAFAAGASDYVVKPFDQIRVVRAKILAALDRRKERAKIGAESHQIALEASGLLAEGKTVAAPSWVLLDQHLNAYELAIRAGASGVVRVVGSELALSQLQTEGIEARLAEPNDLQLGLVDVVVIDTQLKQWRELVERLGPLKPDVLLTAGSNPDLGELLEAIALKVDLVGLNFPGHLSAKVRALLMRQSVLQAKKSLAAALAAFRDDLGK
ncbi:MAG: two-component system response regulator [Myxococcaceae bacterium]|nr:two-component system response regulator [Myxococcaceae bacterium]